MNARVRLLCALAVSLLPACKGGGGGGGSVDTVPGAEAAFTCSYLGGDATTLSSLCVNCPHNAYADARAAIDLDLDTAASMTLYNPNDSAAQQGTLSLRATAPDGVVFAAGSTPGVALQLPVGSNVSYSATVVTYLDSVQRETYLAEPGHAGASNGELAYFGFPAGAATTMAFDAVELIVNESAPGLEQHVFKPIEFCSDGALK